MVHIPCQRLLTSAVAGTEKIQTESLEASCHMNPELCKARINNKLQQ